MIRRLLCVTVICLLAVTTLFDNPIYRPYINEFVFAKGGEWNLEMELYREQNMDGWSLLSKSDTAYFLTGLSVGPGHKVFTRYYLQKPLFFSPVADRVVVRSPQGTQAYLSYGEVPGNTIATPRLEQSICYNASEGFFYLDNIASLGLPNDTLNCMGDLSGTVTDSLNNPLPNVTVTYHDWFGRIVHTDSLGHFVIHDYAKVEDLSFQLPGYNGAAMTVQMRPDTTISLSIKLNLVSSSRDLGSPLPERLRLMPNYPNPFNPETTLELQLPASQFVSIAIHGALGNRVAVLASGKLEAGIHRFHWKPDGLASGIYFCVVSTPLQRTVSKLVYLK
jgi:hypothetical protein